MPRRAVKFAKDNYYHIFNRGAGRHNLFIEADNYLYVLRQTKKISKECRLAIVAYCLMPNHYHYLIRQDGDDPAGDLPRRVFGGYSRAVNKRYGWSGTLFEGRFKANLVDNERYLHHLCRYIHANPVAAGLALRPEEWPFSNYPEWIGDRAGKLVDHQFIDTFFPDREAYAASVRHYLRGKADLPDDIRAYLEQYD